MSVFEKASTLYQSALQGGISEEQMDTVIAWPDEELSVLFACADLVRRKFMGNLVDPCSLMNIKSGGCSEDCAFCSQSAHNHASVNIRDLASPEEIKKQCEFSRTHNLPFCVVSSGRKLSLQEIAIVTGALKECKGEKHASLGILSLEEFMMLRDAGVVCYNHNLETSRSFFPQIVRTHTWEERAETVRQAKQAGLKVCCGGILGLGETWEQRKEFCCQIRELDVDTVPLNFLNPIKGTRIAAPEEAPFQFLKAVSLFRLAMPSKAIKVCGGREFHLGPLQSLMFFAGANGYVSGGYLTTQGAGVDNDDLMIKSLGLAKRNLVEN